MTDQASNQLLSYSIATNGVPTPLTNGTVPTDADPVGMTIDVTGKFLLRGELHWWNDRRLYLRPEWRAYPVDGSRKHTGRHGTNLRDDGRSSNQYRPEPGDLPVYLECPEQFDYRTTSVTAGRQPEADLRVALRCRSFADLPGSRTNHSVITLVGLREY